MFLPPHYQPSPPREILANSAGAMSRDAFRWTARLQVTSSTNLSGLYPVNWIFFSSNLSVLSPKLTLNIIWCSAGSCSSTSYILQIIIVWSSLTSDFWM
jgi:hypothetical protein